MMMWRQVLQSLLIGLLVVLALGLGALAQSVSLTVTAYSDAVRFSAQGAVKELRVEILSLSGQKVFDSGLVLSNALDWKLLNTQGQPVANGVYLYTVTVKDQSGNVTKKLGKLAVLRGKGIAAPPLSGISVGTLANPRLQPLGGPDFGNATVTAGHFNATVSFVAAGIWGIADGMFPQLVFGDSGSTYITMQWYSSADYGLIQTYIAGVATGPLALQAGGGNVGIGTSNPQGILHVAGPAGSNIIMGFSGNSVTSGVVGATIGGGGTSGNTNRVTDNYATVGGGANNQAGNGGTNLTDAHYATVGGGLQNTASNSAATVGGGYNNSASGADATVAGGNSNTASGLRATVGGGQFNSASNSAATVGGGYNNSASGADATVGGGWSNTADGYRATVAGGNTNTASGDWATVGGGQLNRAGGDAATVGGGFNNTAGGDAATVGGGSQNTASGDAATVGGGWSNTASGDLATVGGGDSNSAAGDYSFVVGRRAKNTDNTHDGVFLFADSTNADFFSAAANEFAVRASGGYRLYSNSTLTAGVTLAAGASTWASVSDRALKENFRALDGREVLHQLSLIPILEWNYKAQDAAIRHVGPTAQDFYAAFGLGESDKHISTIDADGIALLSIQALYQLSLEKDKKIAELTQQLEGKGQEIAELRARLEALEKLVQELLQKK